MSKGFGGYFEMEPEYADVYPDTRDAARERSAEVTSRKRSMWDSRGGGASSPAPTPTGGEDVVDDAIQKVMDATYTEAFKRPKSSGGSGIGAKAGMGGSTGSVGKMFMSSATVKKDIRPLSAKEAPRLSKAQKAATRGSKPFGIGELKSGYRRLT